MSNLGGYQTMTTWAKKFGGPVQLFAVVALGGYVFGRTVEAGGKQIAKSVKKLTSTKKSFNAETYVIHTEWKDNSGLHFSINDRFRVLEIADDAVLIERIGDNNNPYFVSADLLHSISSFNHSADKEV